jgi:putative ABC transport system permease protein
MSLFRRSQRDFEEELHSHLEIETDRLIEEGMRPHDARLAARKRFGNLTKAQERYHDDRRAVWLEQLLQDVHYALRMLRKSPVFTLVAIVTLALGIGANTAVFSVVNGVLLSALPYREPDRLVELWESLPDVERIMISYPDFKDWQGRNRVFEDVALYSPYGGLANTSGDIPERLDAGTATSNFFPLLGVQPIVGRGFTPDDEGAGAANVVILGAGYWRSHYAADPGVLGRTISLDGEPYRIVGVVPLLPGFKTLSLWTPMNPWRDTASFNRGNHPGLRGVGRLKPGVTIEQMRDDLSRISREIVAEHPKESSGIGAGGTFFRELMVHNIRPALEVLSWAVLCVLLIACVNVANLVLGRSTSRHKEIALRRALGANESRVFRLLLTENLLLALIGGSIGVGLAYAGVRWLVALRPPGVPRLGNISINLGVLAFAAGASIVTGLVFGLLPARQAARVDLNDSLKEGGRGTSVSGAALRMRGVLMIVEVALALVLLVGAGLLTRSFTRLLRVDPGVKPEGVFTGSLALPAKKFPTEEAQRLALNDVLVRVQSVPGVTSAGLTSALPLSGNMQNKITFEGHPRATGQEPLVQIQLVTPDYFRTMGMRVLMGRTFGPTDVKGSTPVVWIDEAIAKEYFPGENPIGKWLVHGGIDSREPKQIVAGVVTAVHDAELSSRATGIIYIPFDQSPQSWMTLAVKSALPFEQVMPAVRRQIAAFDKQLPLSNQATLADIIDRSIGQEKFTMLVLGIFSLVALVLAAVGVYGVIAYFVAQRSHEIGIRVALGAQRSNIISLVTGRVLATTAIGVALGLAGAAAASRLMANLLYEVTATDLPTYAGCAVVLMGVAIAAAVVPTLRATRVNPATTMRAD